MSKRVKWLQALAKSHHKRTGYADAVYIRKDQNLANVDLEEEPPAKDEDDPEWSYAREIYGQDVDVLHEIRLPHVKGLEACAGRSIPLDMCYASKVHLFRPHITPSNVDVLLDLFPPSIPRSIPPRDVETFVLGFDKFYLNRDIGCSAFTLYLTDGRLDLPTYGGTFGGRRGIRPRFPYIHLTPVKTPDWIWTPDKP